MKINFDKASLTLRHSDKRKTYRPVTNVQGFFSRRKTNSDDFPYIGHRHNFEFYLPLFLLLYNLFKHGKIYSSYKEDNKLILNAKSGLQDCRVGGWFIHQNTY